MYGAIGGPIAVGGGVLAFTGFSSAGYVLTSLGLIIVGALFLRAKSIRRTATSGEDRT